MKTEINPQESSRAQAYNMWLKSPMPMVTLVKTLDVTNLLKFSKRTGIKFTILLCWCIGKAAGKVDEFYLLLEKEKLFRFDKFAINVIVNNCKGGINSCDIPYSGDLQQFNKDYLSITSQAAKECENLYVEDTMVLGTSAMIQTELDCIVNQYTGIFNNPFIAWGKYRKGFFKTTLPVSLHFHHVLIDGGQATRFLEELQQEINHLKSLK